MLIKRIFTNSFFNILILIFTFVWSVDQDIYGRVRQEEGEKGFCNMLCQGQYLDAETELVCNFI